ncbi:MAG: DNA polymerase III subunit delta [Anaerolineae bacterium]|jgi:DNA polymerase-3 subunit delta
MMARPTPTFYVFHGSDEFTSAETVAELRERLASSEMADLNTTWLEGRKVTLTELRHACEAVPFLAKRRLVIVAGLLTRLGKGKGDARFLEALLDLLPNLPETARLVLVEKEPLPADHPVLKLAHSHERGYVQIFEPPSAKALPNWIVKRTEKHGGQIAGDAAAQLAQMVGQDLRLLDQEIMKLVTYVGPESTIAVEDVTRVVPYVSEAVIFDLVDGLGRREGNVAATTLHRLLQEEEPPLRILGMIVRQFRLLIQAKELREARKNAASIARILDLHPYPASKVYRQAANFTPAQLEQIYRYLLATDRQIKTGELDPETALDLVVAGLAERPASA